MCISLYFGILSYRLVFRPTYFTFGYITLSLSIRFAPASKSDVVKRFSAAMFRYFIITLVVVCVGVAGVTTSKLCLRNMQSMLAKATAIGWKWFQIPCAGASVST